MTGLDLGLRLPVTRARGTPHRKRMDALLLVAYHRRGLSLAVCGDRLHLGRAQSTLKRYARRLRLSFPDYTPRNLRWRKRR